MCSIPHSVPETTHRVAIGADKAQGPAVAAPGVFSHTVIKTIEYDHTLAQAIVDTIREPLLVLDEDLRVVAANRSFYSTFKVRPEDTDGRILDTE